MNCDKTTKQPYFPSVIMMKKIQQEEPPIANRFDLVISREALANGKVKSEESHKVISNIYPMLKPGGYAILHMLQGIFKIMILMNRII